MSSSTTIVQCSNCSKQKRLLITIRSHTNRATDKFACSVECAVNYIKSKQLKNYDLLCDNSKIIDEIIDKINE